MLYLPFILCYRKHSITAPYKTIKGNVMIKKLVYAGIALCLFLLLISSLFSADWEKHVIKDDLNKIHYYFNQKEYVVRDLYSKKDIGTTKKVLKRKLASHDVIMLKLSPK